MFRYYQESASCFVFMSDVPTGIDAFDTSVQWQQYFQKSRWFTRGWTLQELLAPTLVQLFSNSGHLLGDKLSMQHVIHEVTGIPIKALLGGSLSDFSVEERMSWATKRTTKREEDEAYSLLGLFGIHMPLIYGEGRRGALTRLRKEIRDSSTMSIEVVDVGQQHRPERLQDIHDWLEPADPTSNHQRALKQRQANTGLWFLRSEEYRHWKTGSASFIWLHGIPGSGKTILSSTVIDDVTSYSRRNSNTIVVYFYFDFNDAHKQPAESLLRSLVAQLSQQLEHVCSELEDLHIQYKRSQGQPSAEALLKTLRQLLQELPQVYLVLDALDECSQRVELLDILATISQWELQNVHVLFTSRLERDIELRIMELAVTPTIVAIRNADVDKDIRQYVRQRLSDDHALKKWNGDPELRSEIEDALIRGSQGMFRWAVCQLDTLGKCRSRARLRASLATLPPTLENTYDRILCNIDEEDSMCSFRILRWLTFANEPMTVDEIAEAVAVDPDRDPVLVVEERLEDPMEALDICASLVIMTSYPGDERQYVVLAHYSVKEYLLSDRIRTGVAAKYSMQYKQSQEILSRACLLYLLQVLESATNLDDVVAQRSPVLCCAGHWQYHVSEAGDGQFVIAHLAIRLLSPGSAFEKWLRICKRTSPSFDTDANSREAGLAHPLPFLATFGLTDVVEVLLSQEIDLETWPWDRPYWNILNNALQSAARNGHTQSVERLLAHGAETNVVCPPWGSALQAACSGGHDRIVQVLLDAGADVNISDGVYDTPLEMALCVGSTAMVELLLKHGADVSHANREGWYPLHFVARYGNFDKAKMLLDHGADVSAVGVNKLTCASLASAQGDARLVQLFHDSGADLSIPDSWGCTPIIAAASGGHQDVVKLLLKYSREDDLPKESVNSHVILSPDTTPNVQTFVRRKGVDPTREDLYGETAASKAALRGQIDILALLFESSFVTPNFRDRYSRSLTWWAAAYGQVDAVNYLIHVHGCDSEMPDACRRTPLMIAAKKGHHRVVRAFGRERNDALNVYDSLARDPDGQSMLLCDICTVQVDGAEDHYHCSICANGDWDICSECFEHGTRCKDGTHVVTKRTMVDGAWIESS